MTLYIIHNGEEIEVESDAMSQEDAAIKSDLYEKLSEEAKEVVSIILKAPPELIKFDVITYDGKWKKRDGDNQYYLKRYFRKLWGSRLLVKHAFKELETFVKSIY